MKKLRTVIVDDEPLARERLASLLSAEQDIEVVRQCRDGEEAVSAIDQLTPDGRLPTPDEASRWV